MEPRGYYILEWGGTLALSWFYLYLNNVFESTKNRGGGVHSCINLGTTKNGAPRPQASAVTVIQSLHEQTCAHHHLIKTINAPYCALERPFKL